MPILLAGRWADIVRWSSFYEAPGELTPASSYSTTLELTNCTKGLEMAPVWTIAIHKTQSILV